MGASHCGNYIIKIPVNSILLGVAKLYFCQNGMLPKELPLNLEKKK